MKTCLIIWSWSFHDTGYFLFFHFFVFFVSGKKKEGEKVKVERASSENFIYFIIIFKIFTFDSCQRTINHKAIDYKIMSWPLTFRLDHLFCSAQKVLLCSFCRFAFIISFWRNGPSLLPGNWQWQWQMAMAFPPFPLPYSFIHSLVNFINTEWWKKHFLTI